MKFDSSEGRARLNEVDFDSSLSPIVSFPTTTQCLLLLHHLWSSRSFKLPLQSSSKNAWQSGSRVRILFPPPFELTWLLPSLFSFADPTCVLPLPLFFLSVFVDEQGYDGAIEKDEFALFFPRSEELKNIRRMKALTSLLPPSCLPPLPSQARRRVRPLRPLRDLNRFQRPRW